MLIRHAILLSCASVCVFGCASNNAPFNPQIGIPEFRSWSQAALSNAARTREQEQFKRACHGDSVALRSFFRDAYAMQMSSEMRPAKEEFLSWILETLLNRIGDAQFSESLIKEPSAVRSAIGKFLEKQGLKPFPKTQKILQESTSEAFPLDRAYRKNDA